MADRGPLESSSHISSASSESTVELNIKTLDSQIFKLHVDKNIPVSLFKEKIASEIGLPVGQQRLIFRGKVLKDNHLLSEYHVENGHTLHLVARQPSQPQHPHPSGSSSGDSNANTNVTGQDASAAGSLPRIGQLSHSIVLGTIGVGEQGDAGVPDISRVIGMVLNSLGIGSQIPVGGTGGPQPNIQFNLTRASQENEREGLGVSVSNQGQEGDQSQPRQASPSQPLPQVLQIPIGAAIAVPSLAAPIPDSLNTLSEFMNRMELALSRNGNQPNQPLNNSGGLPVVELPTDARGFPSPAALAVVLRHAQRLLTGHPVSSLSHIAGRLEQEGGSNDLTVRSHIQAEALQAGLAMQHLGSLFLELGRTMMTLRMGQSSEESSVNAGPAVYISSSGPNPIMVQPFPLQTSSLFGGYLAPPLNPGVLGPVGVGAVPRHVNIHIHTAVGPRSINGEANQVERTNGTGDSDLTGVMHHINATSTVDPSRPAAVSVSDSAVPSVVTLPQSSPNALPLPPTLLGVNLQSRNIVDDMQNENQNSQGPPESIKSLDKSIGSGSGNGENSNQTSDRACAVFGGTNMSVPERMSEAENRLNAGGVVDGKNVSCISTESCSNGESFQKMVNDGDCASASSGVNISKSSTNIPLGLGLGGLQPKRRSRHPRSQGTSSNSPSTTDNSMESRPDPREVLQSLANMRNPNALPVGQMGSMVSRDEGADAQFDSASVMSQVIRSPALDGLLTGVSQQTGIGSPDMLRNMLGQLARNPTMMNTVNRIAQQIDSHDLGSVFSGLGDGQHGGIDLSRMVQQMMPIVSQALGGGSNPPQSVPASELEVRTLNNERGLNRRQKLNDRESQNDLQQVRQRIEQLDPPQEVFGSIVESALSSSDSGIRTGDLANELSSEDGLVNEFVEMLRKDVSRRLQDESGPSNES